MSAAARLARDSGVQPTLHTLGGYSTVSDGATVAVWALATLAIIALDWAWSRRRGTVA